MNIKAIKNCLLYFVFFTVADFIMKPILEFLYSLITKSTFTFSWTSNLVGALEFGFLFGVLWIYMDRKKIFGKDE